jgi:uncharacterized membrane protein (UPF0136 family)
MRRASYLVLIYGILILVGGIAGYIRAHSLPSLVMGGVFGILLLIGSVNMMKERKWGFYLSWACAVILTAFFGYRSAMGAPLVPTGLLAMISFLMTVRLSLNYRLTQ